MMIMYGYMCVYIFTGTSLSSIVSHLKPSTIYYFRLQAATFAENSPLSDIVHIRTQDPNDLNCKYAGKEFSDSTCNISCVHCAVPFFGL